MNSYQAFNERFMKYRKYFPVKVAYRMAAMGINK